MVMTFVPRKDFTGNETYYSDLKFVNLIILVEYISNKFGIPNNSTNQLKFEHVHGLFPLPLSALKADPAGESFVTHQSLAI